MKKIITTLALIALLATMAMGLVACTETNLDGTYVDKDHAPSVIIIQGSTIKMLTRPSNGSADELEDEGTFTLKDNILTIDWRYEAKQITITKEGNLRYITTAVGTGEELITIMIKQ